MKIVMISDTHNKLNLIIEDLPEGDLLIHAGDATMGGTAQEIINFNRDLGKVRDKFKYGIIFCAGNHDWGFQRDNARAKSFITNAIYLEDSFVEVEGLKIYGSPWQPYFFNWAFNLQRGAEIKQKWDLIPEDIDVLITHGPAFGILDSVGPNQHNPIQKNVGCEELRKKIDSLDKLKLHVCGHIHMENGAKKVGNKMFINASILNDHYLVANKPIIYNL